jgi:hypothetical protein
MFYNDLEPYLHGVPVALPDVVTVGWLSRGHEFPVGEAPLELVPALDNLLCSHRVNPTRGIHVCEFCSIRQQHMRKTDGRLINLGSAEIWIPSVDKYIIYAAPDLIYHYVKDHKYLPPHNFIISAINTIHVEEWNANEECERRLEAAYR